MLCGQSETSAFDRSFVLRVMNRTLDVMRRVVSTKERALLLNDILIRRNEDDMSRVELPTSSLISSHEMLQSHLVSMPHHFLNLARLAILKLKGTVGHPRVES